MNRKIILAALASAAMAAAGPALAQGRGHGQAGIGVGHGQGSVGVHARGGIGVGVGMGRDRVRTRSNVGIETRTRARANSQGPANANIRAHTRANANSVLNDDLLPPNLAGLRTGLVVRNSSGITVGTVRRIQTSADGSVRAVLIAGIDGSRRLIPVSPRTLIVDGDVVTTTSTRFNDD